MTRARLAHSSGVLRLDGWDCDRTLYKKRNEIEMFFRRLKGFRRIFLRFDKLTVSLFGFLNFALIVEGRKKTLNTRQLGPLRHQARLD